MEIILLMIVYVLINLGFLFFIDCAEKRMCKYDTIFCRDVRAQLGMFAYVSDVEQIREKLNRPNSKF